MTTSQQKKLDKMFNVLRVSRQDLVDNDVSEAEALAVTGTQMQKIAEGMAEGLTGNGDFGYTLKIAYDYTIKNK